MDEQDTTVTHATESAQGLNGAEDSGSEDEEQYFIRIDRRRLPEELSRLEKSDKEFGNLLHARIGSREAERSQPRIEAMELELSELRQQRRWDELERMAPDEIEKKYASDDRFAREWTDFVHRNPAASDARREALVISQRVDKIINRAMADGLTTEVIDRYKMALQRGDYDKDEEGQPISHWSDGLDRLRDDLTNELTSTRTTRRPPSDGDTDEDEDEESSPPRRVASDSTSQSSDRLSSPNPALVRGGPDTTPSSGGTLSRRKTYRTQQQVDKDLYDGKIDTKTAREWLAKGLPYQ